MVFRFQKIPKLAIACYSIGFLVVIVSIAAARFAFWPWSSVSLLQTLITGALVVVIGSVINTIEQFRKK